MTPRPGTANRPSTPNTQRDASVLRDRAWRALVDLDGGPVTAASLAEAARITRGGALAFLAGWTAAGLVEAGPPPAGRHAPADIPHTAPALAAALAAAGRGWRVFPLRPDAKRPAFPDHTADRCTRADPWCRDGHTGWEPRATTDRDRIRRAWSTRRYGIGVACGPSGLLVVDLDQPKTDDGPPEPWRLDGVHDGSDVLAALAEQAGQPFPAATHTVHTGRGGTHLYFTAPAGTRLGNTAGALGWLVDTRGHGGYVVGSGSTVDGRPYTVALDQPAAPLPDWLAGRLTAPAARPRPAAPAPAAGRLPAYLRAAVAREVAVVAAAPEGRRNRILFTAAVALGQLVAGGALPADLVTAELEQAAVGIGLGQAEAASTIRSGLRAGGRRPRRPGQAAA